MISTERNCKITYPKKAKNQLGLQENSVGGEYEYEYPKLYSSTSTSASASTSTTSLLKAALQQMKCIFFRI